MFTSQIWSEKCKIPKPKDIVIHIYEKTMQFLVKKKKKLNKMQI